MATKKVGLRAVFETPEFQRGVTIYTQGIKIVNQGARNAESQSGKSSQAISQSWTKSFAKVAAAATAVIAAYKAVTAATRQLAEVTKLAARVETLGVVLEVVGENAGYSSTEVAEFTKGVKEQGITTQAAQQSLLLMAGAQIDWSKASGIARLAQDAAVIANVNSSEAFQTLTYIIQTGNTRMARRLNLMVSFEAAYRREADALGKNKDELTEQEKVQARVNEVMRAGAGISGAYTAAMETTGKQALSLARHMEESQLIIGNTTKEAWGVVIRAQTEALKGFQEWAKRNEEELEALSVALQTITESIVGATRGFALFMDTDLTAFVEGLTRNIEKVGEALETLRKMIALADAGVKMFKEFGEQLWKTGDYTEAATQAANKYDETLLKHVETMKEVEKEQKKVAEAPPAPIVDEAAMEAERASAEAREKAAETLTKSLDQIQKVYQDHHRSLARMDEDAGRRRARAYQQYQKSFQKEHIKGQVSLIKITDKYEKTRAKTLADGQRRIADAERNAHETRERAQRNYALREQQTRERYQLDNLQSERRYQFERDRLVAEGDTLAIEQLDARYALEQQERGENEQLRQRQTSETQAEQIREAGQAAREEVESLRYQLQEQLAEQEQTYLAEIEAQKQANAQRLAEMAVNYQEQQALQAENDAIAKQRADENYKRQLEAMGANLADEEALQEMGAQQTEQILQQYYGAGGTADRIMEGYHQRENTRIAVTSAMLQSMATLGTMRAPPSIGGFTGGRPATGFGVGMQEGGILTGPARAYVESGVTEAFVPLTGPGAGGAFTHEFLNALQVSGLGQASPTDASAFLREFTQVLTATLRTKRRN